MNVNWELTSTVRNILSNFVLYTTCKNVLTHCCSYRCINLPQSDIAPNFY